METEIGKYVVAITATLTFINLGILALMIKLYTEIFKERVKK